MQFAVWLRHRPPSIVNTRARTLVWSCGVWLLDLWSCSAGWTYYLFITFFSSAGWSYHLFTSFPFCKSLVVEPRSKAQSTTLKTWLLKQFAFWRVMFPVLFSLNKRQVFCYYAITYYDFIITLFIGIVFNCMVLFSRFK